MVGCIKENLMRLIRNIVLILGHFLGFNLLFRFINSAKIRVLMYHGVASSSLDVFCWTVLDKEKFIWQMEYVKKRYKVASASSVLVNRSSWKPERHTTVISFDDGLANTYSEVWPVLRRLGLCAICFVLPGLSRRGEQIWADQLFDFLLKGPAGILDLNGFGLGNIELEADPKGRTEVIDTLLTQLKSWPNEKRQNLLTHLLRDTTNSMPGRTNSFRLMSLGQIKELADSHEFEIGIHSDFHPIMSSVSRIEQEKEIQSALDGLEQAGVKFQPIFAYPNGRPDDFNEDTIAALRKFGLLAAVTTVDNHWNRDADNFRIKRIAIGADVGKWEFKARMSGYFYFLGRIAGKQ